MINPKRKFSGKIYSLYTWENTRPKAEAEASGLRKEGHLARVAKGLQSKPKRVVWCVYVKKSRR